MLHIYKIIVLELMCNQFVYLLQRLWKHIKHRYENPVTETRYTHDDQPQASTDDKEND